RHWAAKGLLNLAASGLPVPDGMETAFGRESDPQVRIPLGEALGNLGDSRRWVSELTTILVEEVDPRTKLYALDALTWLPLHADISLEAVRALHGHDDTYLRQSSDYLAQRLDGTYKPTNTIFNMERYDPG